MFIKKKESILGLQVLIAGDIGGTKTHLALFDIKEDKLVFLQGHKYKSQEYDGLEPILKDFLKKIKQPIKGGTLGIAGPIVNGVVKTPNLPWTIKLTELKQKTGIEQLYLINDLEATAYGTFELSAKDVHFLSEIKTLQLGNRAVIAAGTGLGQACLYFDSKTFHPFATEAGHAEFAPKNEVQVRYLQFMLKKYDHVSFDRVLSGSGLVSMFEFFTQTDSTCIDNGLKEEMSKQDPAKVITQYALEQKNKCATAALELFVNIYGQEAGNMALRFLATGGVYIGGGIAPKILKELEKPMFMQSFILKGRMEQLLSKIGVIVILNEQTALLGAAHHAKMKL